MERDHAIPVLDHGYVQLIDYMAPGLNGILRAARMSTGRPTGEDPVQDLATLNHLYRNKHSTPFEFAELVVEVQVPIFVAREWHRHRTQVYGEMSGRYTEMPDLQYLPTLERIQVQSKTNKQGSGIGLPTHVQDSIRQSMQWEQQTSRAKYESYREEGAANEIARINLPLSQYTRFQAKCNLRNWLGFLTLRMAPGAQYEIRVFANAVAEIIKDLWPETWELFEEFTLHAVTFSRTEMTFLRDLVNTHGGLALENLRDGGRLATAMGKSRATEFVDKFRV